MMFVLPLGLFAQFSVDAGGNRHICSNFDSLPNEVQLHANVSGGVEPYIYNWFINPIEMVSGTILYASQLLNDTTIADPIIGDLLPMQLYLEVIDAEGNVARDSLEISVSVFAQSLHFMSFTIQEGDSIYLNYGSNISGGVGNLTYQWLPTDGLSESTIHSGFWAKPNVTTVYSLTVTDEMGCSVTGAPFYYINVSPASIDDVESVAFEFYPNPIQDYFVVENRFHKLGVRAKLTDMSGKALMEFDLNEEKNNISVESLPSGFYLLHVQDTQQKVLYTAKVVVK